MNSILKSEKGASSILVILLLVVLVVFGVAALTTALSNVRLGQKTADWNDKYYSADAKANEVYAQIDEKVTESSPEYLIVGSSAGFTLSDNEFFSDNDIEVAEDNGVLEFSYEVWEQNVGISVVLSYDLAEDEFTILKYKAVQAKAEQK